MLERIFPNHWGGARWLLEILLVCFPFPFPPSRRQTWRRTNPKTIMLLECSTRSIKTKKAKQTRSQANANIFNEPTETNNPTSSSCYPVMTQNQSNNNLTTTGLEWMTIGQWMDFFGQGTISWWQLILFGGSTHFPWKRNEIVLAHGLCFWRWDAKIDQRIRLYRMRMNERRKETKERKTTKESYPNPFFCSDIFSCNERTQVFSGHWACFLWSSKIVMFRGVGRICNMCLWTKQNEVYMCRRENKLDI